MTFSDSKISKLQSLLYSAKEVMIVAHRGPDGDAIGSSMALTHILRKLGKTVHTWMPDEIASYLLAVPGAEDIGIYEGQGKEAYAILKECDMIFCLDFNRMERTGPMSQVLHKAKQPKVMIDHHLNPDEGFDILFSDTQASSTCELVYLLAEAMDWKEHIDLTIATCIYTGLVTDTGSFKYNVHPNTHRIAGELIALGLDSAKVQGDLFDTNTRDRLGLMGFVLNDKLVYRPQKAASYMTLTKEELVRFNYKKGDTEGLVNFGLSIAGVQFTSLASEKDGVVKISLRSKGDLDVNVIANQRFGGGGHKNAAGARSEAPMSEVIKILEDIIDQLPSV
jgi:phosphoesterase RecJ-like protein